MKCYIVISSEGVYEDYHEYIERVYFDKDKAEQYAKELDKFHDDSQINPLTEKQERIYDKVEYEVANMDKFDFNNVRKRCPVYKRIDDPIAYDNFWNENEEELQNTILEKLQQYPEFGTTYTRDDMRKYKEYLSSMYCEWHKTRVVEKEIF